MSFRDNDNAHTCPLCQVVGVMNLLATASNVVINYKCDQSRLPRKIESLRLAILALGPDIAEHYRLLGFPEHKESPYITGEIDARKPYYDVGDNVLFCTHVGATAIGRITAVIPCDGAQPSYTIFVVGEGEVSLPVHQQHILRRMPEPTAG